MSAGAQKRDVYHGIVLSKLSAHKNRKLNLCMIETRKDEPGSFYTVNDEIYLYMKYKTGRASRGNLVCDFQFQNEHIQDLKEYTEKKPVYLVLICLDQKKKKKNKWLPAQAYSPQICLLRPKKREKCFKLNPIKRQTLTVKYHLHTGESFRVYGALNSSSPLIINRTEIDSWKIPGS